MSHLFKTLPLPTPPPAVGEAVKKKKPKVVIPMHQKLAVGAVAGIIGTSIIFPLDVVKTRLQNQKADPKTGELMYKGMVDGFRKILAKDGLKKMYQGLSWNLKWVTPEKAIKLGANDYFREKLGEVDGNLSIGRSILAGGGAGFLQVIATNPMEIVKARMQMQTTKPKSERFTTNQVVRQLGLKGMYKGTLVTWMRDVPYSIVFFPGYAILKGKLTPEGGEAETPQILVAGAVAGAAAAWICTPADCIKTRYQAEGSTFTSIRQCFNETVQKEGSAALFKGAIPRMCVTAPLFGIALYAFEMQKKYILGEPPFGPKE